MTIPGPPRLLTWNPSCRRVWQGLQLPVLQFLLLVRLHGDQLQAAQHVPHLSRNCVLLHFIQNKEFHWILFIKLTCGVKWRSNSCSATCLPHSRSRPIIGGVLTGASEGVWQEENEKEWEEDRQEQERQEDG
jgi:hypothetical protein